MGELKRTTNQTGKQVSSPAYSQFGKRQLWILMLKEPWSEWMFPKLFLCFFPWTFCLCCKFNEEKKKEKHSFSLCVGVINFPKLSRKSRGYKLPLFFNNLFSSPSPPHAPPLQVTFRFPGRIQGHCIILIPLQIPFLPKGRQLRWEGFQKSSSFPLLLTNLRLTNVTLTLVLCTASPHTFLLHSAYWLSTVLAKVMPSGMFFSFLFPLVPQGDRPTSLVLSHYFKMGQICFRK